MILIKVCDNYFHSNTLGCKAKDFWWKLDEDYNLHIIRKFKGFEYLTTNIVTRKELDIVDAYVSQAEWVDLANNVEKLSNGTEKDGIDKFLCESLGWKVGDAQLASQLGAIFSLAGVWEFNGKTRGIQFKHRGKEWKVALRALADKLFLLHNKGISPNT